MSETSMVKKNLIPNTQENVHIFCPQIVQTEDKEGRGSWCPGLMSRGEGVP